MSPLVRLRKRKPALAQALAPAVLSLLTCAPPLHALDIAETFSRANSPVAGFSEASAVNRWRWCEYGDNDSQQLIQIAGNKLDFHYFRAGATSNLLACTLGKPLGPDVDLTVEITPYSAAYGQMLGFGYRLDSQDGRFWRPGGYYVQCDVLANTIKLWFGDESTPFAQATPSPSLPSSGSFTVRAVVVGSQHQISVNGVVVLTHTESTPRKTSGGYAGVFTAWSIATFDNFTAVDRTNLWKVSDTFTRANTIEAGTAITQPGWLEVGDNSTDNLISIDASSLSFHYFVTGSSSPSLACSLPGLPSADIDLNATLEPYPYSSNYRVYYGLSYRLPSPQARYQDAGGYYLRLDEPANTVTLYYGTSTVATASVDVPNAESEVRILAQGSRHRVFLNGAPIIDASHSGNLTAGYAGVFSWYSIMRCTEFTLTALPSIRPKGTQFPLGLYGVSIMADMAAEKCFGWNLMHSYAAVHDLGLGTDTLGNTNIQLFNVDGSRNSWLDDTTDAGMAALGSLPFRQAGAHSDPREHKEYPATGRPTVPAEITRISSFSGVGWWDKPEELRSWLSPEDDMMTDYFDWTRDHDPEQRPVMMYLPSHYGAVAYLPHLSTLDIITAAAYTTYRADVHLDLANPYPWVRWRVSSVAQAITDNALTIGDDYLNDMKTPVAVLELFFSNPDLVQTPEGAYHDFWQSVVSGARGILVYSPAYRQTGLIKWNDAGTIRYRIPGTGETANCYPLLNAWYMYCKAASELSGPEQLGRVVLDGTSVPTVSFSVTQGTVNADPIHPYGMAAVTYPSLHLMTKTYQGTTYVFAVNSRLDAVTATISNLPIAAGTAKVLFQGRNKAVSVGQFSDTFPPLGVNIYKISP